MMLRIACAVSLLVFPVFGQKDAAASKARQDGSAADSLFYRAFFLERGERRYQEAIDLYRKFLAAAPEHRFASRAADAALNLLNRVGQQDDAEKFRQEHAGNSFKLNVSQAKKGARAFILFGASTSSINLGGIGAAGCVVRATPSIAAGFNIASTGSGSLSVNVPNNTSLIKKSFYNQGVVLDSGANKLGVALTRGGKGTVGKQ